MPAIGTGSDITTIWAISAELDRWKTWISGLERTIRDSGNGSRELYLARIEEAGVAVSQIEAFLSQARRAPDRVDRELLDAEWERFTSSVSGLFVDNHG